MVYFSSQTHSTSHIWIILEKFDVSRTETKGQASRERKSTINLIFYGRLELTSVSRESLLRIAYF